MRNEKLLEKLKFVKKVKSLSEAKEYLADLNTDENDVLIYTKNNRILCFPGVIKTRQIENMWEKAQKWCDGDSRDLLLFYYAGTKPCMANAALVEFLVFGQNITKKHLETHAEASRDGKKRSGQELFNGRINRNHKKDSENLHKYRLQKITDGKRTVRKQHYNIQPHDIIVYESRKHETAGCHCNGARVMILPDKKSVSIKKIKIYKYAGGYFKSAFN